MAEALARRRYGAHADFESVGLFPQGPEDTTGALDTLRHEFGIDIEHFVPRNLRSVDVTSFSTVVAMDSEIAAELREHTSRDIVIWHINDPWGGDPAEYKRCALRILSQLADLVASVR